MLGFDLIIHARPPPRPSGAGTFLAFLPAGAAGTSLTRAGLGKCGLLPPRVLGGAGRAITRGDGVSLEAPFIFSARFQLGQKVLPRGAGTPRFYVMLWPWKRAGRPGRVWVLFFWGGGANSLLSGRPGPLREC